MISKLRCHRRFDLGERRGLSREIHIVDGNGNQRQEYEFLCASIDSDIESADGSGATAIKLIKEVETSLSAEIHREGNEWITHISQNKVWFEDKFSDDKGGDVSLEQYKFAIETFVRYLTDPTRTAIEVDFPE
jgi:hypothetical protein